MAGLWAGFPALHQAGAGADRAGLPDDPVDRAAPVVVAGERTAAGLAGDGPY